MTTDKQLRFVENYLAYLLAKSSHLISDGFHRVLRQQGISISVWRILAVLHDGPCSVGGLAEKVLINQPTMSKTLDKMEEEGFIVRRRDTRDMRAVKVSLTAEGRRQVKALIPLANAHEVRAFAHLSGEEKRQLIHILQSTIASNTSAEEKE